jgi:hypothetical protein
LLKQGDLSSEIFKVKRIYYRRYFTVLQDLLENNIILVQPNNTYTLRLWQRNYELFLWTPDFAVGILDAILQNNYNVGVITAADKPAGRVKNKFSTVKNALKQRVTLLQPVSLRWGFYNRIKKLKANLYCCSILECYQDCFDMPALETFNLHASLLQYRGAAPIKLGNYQWRKQNRSHYLFHWW